MKKKINLWLDDVRVAPVGWHHANTVERAKTLMEHFQVEEMSLDCDMDLCPKCHSSESLMIADVISPSCTCNAPNGVDFVQWMVDNNKWPAKKPRVHSANIELSAVMREMIDKHFPASDSPKEE